MKTTIKSIIQHVFRRFGYKINKLEHASVDPFVVQKELTTAERPVIFDLGAHNGRITQKYRDLFPQSLIYCFEPFPKSFQALTQNMSGDDRTFCHNLALSDTNGMAVFNSNRSSLTNSLLSTDEYAVAMWGDDKEKFHTETKIRVPTKTLDSFCHENNIQQIDLLKMDVQGAEFAVLMGATDLLKQRRISLIYTELILCPTYNGQHKLHEYLSFLDSCGYELLDFYNHTRNQHKLIQADVIFVRSP